MFQEGHSLQLSEDLQWETVSVPTHMTMYDLVFQFAEIPCGPQKEMRVCASIEYNTDLFLPSTIDAFLDVFLCVLRQASSNTHTTIEDLRTVQDPPLAHLARGPVPDADILEFGPTIRIPLQHSSDANFVHLFEQIVAAHPNDTALTFGFPESVGGMGLQTMTYKELHRQSGIVARHPR